MNVSTTGPGGDFAEILRKLGCEWGSTLPPEVLAFLESDDGRAAFITWFEGRADYQPEDWFQILILLTILRRDLFEVVGVV